MKVLAVLTLSEGVRICLQASPFASGGFLEIVFLLCLVEASPQALPPSSYGILPGYVVVQSLSSIWLFATSWTAAHQASLFFTISWSLLKLMFIELVMPSNHPILCRPLLLLPSIFPSIRVFSNESVLRIRWPKYWSFSFNISPSSVYSRLTSFRIDRFNLLAVQGILSLFQHHTSKASVIQCSDFFMVQLSHPYMTTVETISLTIWIFVSKVMSLTFNMLSRFSIAFLPRSKYF